MRSVKRNMNGGKKYRKKNSRKTRKVRRNKGRKKKQIGGMKLSVKIDPSKLEPHDIYYIDGDKRILLFEKSHLENLQTYPSGSINLLFRLGQYYKFKIPAGFEEQGKLVKSGIMEGGIGSNPSRGEFTVIYSDVHDLPIPGTPIVPGTPIFFLIYKKYDYSNIGTSLYYLQMQRSHNNYLYFSLKPIYIGLFLDFLKRSVKVKAS